MHKPLRTWVTAGAAALGISVGLAGLAGAATSGSTPTATPAVAAATTTTPAATAPDPATLSHGPGETPLTDGTATKVEAAAKAALPGATIIRVETDSGGAAYEAHMRKADGSEVTLKFDSSFKVTATQDGFGSRPGDNAPQAPAGTAPAGA